ncbi:hypothetical protein NADFUDRAFT_63824 [Nadsonia fulvescens var. elongata DSM 6958]|uniref:Uncharacterized protein n=1 Tax=Nadsonia fulvescens var. elongata DSM 6958 TaxID=857566 RepID=A0A1E3PU60_9ASCO|nr:hypothetical protein NADFUDRAFT_63824 [Nadsonia fulvescens var. elongata DSM 6958]
MTQGNPPSSLQSLAPDITNSVNMTASNPEGYFKTSTSPSSPLKASNIFQGTPTRKSLTNLLIKKPTVQETCAFSEKNPIKNGSQPSDSIAKREKMPIHLPGFGGIRNFDDHLALELFEIFLESDEQQEKTILDQRILNTSFEYCKKNIGHSEAENEEAKDLLEFAESNENHILPFANLPEGLLGKNVSITTDFNRLNISGRDQGDEIPSITLKRDNKEKDNIDKRQALFEKSLLNTTSDNNSQSLKISSSKVDSSSNCLGGNEQTITHAGAIKNYSLTSSSRASKIEMKSKTAFEEDKENSNPLK